MKAGDALEGVQRGLAGGLAAGVFFLGFEMAASALLHGPVALAEPLRMIGGILLGPSALDSGYPLLTAATAGLIVHGVLAAAFGAVFGWAVSARPLRPRRRREIVAAGSVWGLVLWLLNFYVVAPLAGWPWFALQTNPAVQLVAHAVFFGGVLGLYVAPDGRPLERRLIPAESGRRPRGRAEAAGEPESTGSVREPRRRRDGPADERAGDRR